VITNINNTPSKALNGATPASFKTGETDPQCREARRIVAEKKLQSPTAEAGAAAAAASASDKPPSRPPFKEGDFVYADLRHKNVFLRGFDVARQQVFQIKRVEQQSAPGQPPLYTLQEWTKDGTGRTLKQRFYAENLRRMTEDPTKHLYAIEKILDERKRPEHHEKEYEVKWAGVEKPEWITESWLTKKSLPAQSKPRGRGGRGRGRGAGRGRGRGGRGT
jgi:hypothetical protein